MARRRSSRTSRYAAAQDLRIRVRDVKSLGATLDAVRRSSRLASG
jgi:uncharacterized protein YggE